MSDNFKTFRHEIKYYINFFEYHNLRLRLNKVLRHDKYGDVDAATIYNKWLGKGILRMDHEDYLMASKFFSKAWKKYPSNKDPYCLQVISIVRSYSYSLGGYNIDLNTYLYAAPCAAHTRPLVEDDIRWQVLRCMPERDVWERRLRFLAPPRVP